MSEMHGENENYQLYRKCRSDPGNPQASGNMACPIKAAAENSCPADDTDRREFSRREGELIKQSMFNKGPSDEGVPIIC